MIKYVIALKELGIQNDKLIFLIKNYSTYIIKMFNDKKVFETEFELLIYQDYFADQAIVDEALARAESILLKNKELKIKTTYYMAQSYPKELEQIKNPPAIIYYKGAEFSEVSKYSIACVGTREPTRLSYRATNYLIPQLVNVGCSIISGLALGVDRLAHQACISSGGKTIAVLAHGLDIVYPEKNIDLSERILQNGGIIMSEYPVGVRGNKYRFVNRNRLIVGMAKAVIICECSEKSGTMHNVEFARQQNKPIFCPQPDEKNFDVQSGTKLLIAKHIATVIKNGRDIAGVLKAVNVTISKSKMSSERIKEIFLHSMLVLTTNEQVIDAIIQDLKLPLQRNQFLTKNLVEIIKENLVDMDELLNSIIDNNILIDK